MYKQKKMCKNEGIRPIIAISKAKNHNYKCTKINQKKKNQKWKPGIKPCPAGIMGF